ncbi:hypothetical protein BB987_11695 [Photorhabdus temperata]|uniref:Uncharacterized protein n=1 Tax=Photorhabdus khanii NC19 TaxID=1004151 RepID=W3V8A2_9GAMM|nr:hypothetical protein [Photorhabdus khanii]ETS32176.1 hypothetical protein PTE_01482 [Photorhabdus khanii NC19]OHV53733.1 hypothetical protein BB987_11695 [Photorhabdus temperata]
MKILYPEAPLGGVDVIIPVLREALQTAQNRPTSPFSSVDPNSLIISDPYRCYSLGIENLVNGEVLNNAIPGNWRYFILSDGKTIADLELREVDGELKFSSLNEGPIASSAVNALRLAECSTRHEGKMYELRMLLVSGLHFVSMWLHAIDKGLSDAVIPTEPTPANLAGMRLYDEVEIIKLLHIAAKQAKERLDADDSELLGN